MTHAHNAAFGAGGRRCRYPVATMQVGESFEAPNDLARGRGISGRRQSITSSAWYYRRRYDQAAQFQIELHPGFVRCTRVA